MVDGAPAKKVFKWDVKENRRKPKLRWKDQVAKNLEQLGVENWRRRAENRVAWRGIIKDRCSKNQYEWLVVQSPNQMISAVHGIEALE